MSTLTILDLNRTIFIPCDCRSEVLMLDYDHELKIADISIYENMNCLMHKLSLWQRIRYAFRVLIYGKPYGDQLVLSSKQLKQLQNFLFSLDL